MTKRNKIIVGVAIGIGIILLLVLIWWLLRLRSSGGVTPGPVGGQQPQRIPVSSGVTQNTPASIQTGRADVDANLKTIGETFAERFGSYSNQGETVAIADIQPLVTPGMQKTASDMLAADIARLGDPSTYAGITTKATRVTITSFDGSFGQAEVLVTTQRQEFIGSPQNPTTRYQQLKLKLVQTGRGWRVDQAAWQ
jgi:hypothetical protein